MSPSEEDLKKRSQPEGGHKKPVLPQPTLTEQEQAALRKEHLDTMDAFRRKLANEQDE